MNISFLSLFLLVASNQGFVPTLVYPASFVKSSLHMTAESLANQKEIKVGVIGCGRIGLVHLGAITKCPNVTPVIVSNPTVAKAEAAAKQYNVARFTADAMDVITDPEVDAVWICSPSQYHPEQIKAAAANGKHVFL